MSKIFRVYTPKAQHLESLEDEFTLEEIHERYFVLKYYGLIDDKWRPLVDFDPFDPDSDKRIMYDDGFSYIWQKRDPDFMYLRKDIFEDRYPEHLI